MVYTSARMKEKNRRLFWFAFLIFSVAAAVPSVYGGERTVPVDLFILVDKSLSMGESEKFPGVLAWTEEQLTGQMLVEGDWLTLYQFYGESENLLTTTIRDDSDRETVRRAFTVIRPDGRFTDIGLALDTIKEALDSRKDNGRYKIMILLTDLKQEAPWTSKYPGVIDPFESPYLAEARMVDHGGWYEITLDMDIHDTVVTVSRDLFREIAALGEAEREIEPETETDFVRTQNPQTAPGGEPAAGESGALEDVKWSVERVKVVAVGEQPEGRLARLTGRSKQGKMTMADRKVDRRGCSGWYLPYDTRFVAEDWSAACPI